MNFFSNAFCDVTSIFLRSVTQQFFYDGCVVQSVYNVIVFSEVEPMGTSNSQMTVKPERDVWKAEMEERLDNKKKMQDQVESLVNFEETNEKVSLKIVLRPALHLIEW